MFSARSKKLPCSPYCRLKYLVAFIVLLGLFLQNNLSAILATFGFFSATAISADNLYQTGTLQLGLDKTTLDPLTLNQEFSLAVLNPGTLPFQYQFKITTDNQDFCADLNLTATLGDALYTGPLNNFLSTTTIVALPSDQWRFLITDPQKNPAGQTCAFEIIFHAWQTNHHLYDPVSGFTDSESISGQVGSDAGSGGPECIQVLEPNGGEVWWVGRTHKIGWTTINPMGRDSDLTIDLYYSNDSGASWGLIKQGLNNTGSYFWRVSLMLENNTYWVPSDTARVKLIAHYPDGSICGWDMSDEDYCPPIETALLTPEELAWLAEHDLMALAESESNEPPASPLPSTATGFPVDPVATSTAPIIPAQSAPAPAAPAIANDNPPLDLFATSTPATSTPDTLEPLGPPASQISSIAPTQEIFSLEPLPLCPTPAAPIEPEVVSAEPLNQSTPEEDIFPVPEPVAVPVPEPVAPSEAPIEINPGSGAPPDNFNPQDNP